MSATPRVGFVLSHEQFPATRLVELGVAAENAGFDALWTSDHFHPWQDNQGHSGQAWITLAAIGQRTRRIPFGTGVTCPTFRYRPAVVAQAFASLAVLSPGRVFLGVGSGEALNEVPSGGGWGDARTRFERLMEAVGLIRQLWTGEWVHHVGQYFQVENARIYDPPPQPVPIYIAGSGRRAAQSAGELGDGWITDTHSLTNSSIRAAFDNGVRSAGNQPDRRVLVESYVVVGGVAEAEEAARFWRFVPIGFKELLDEPDPREIQRVAEQRLSLQDVYRTWVVSADPGAHVEALQKQFEAGATDVFIHSGQSDQQRVIDFYASAVLPRLRELAHAA
jgi:TAT-translocated FGD2 family F420-dependent dehydrogenase